jgi:hypothetical protein
VPQGAPKGDGSGDKGKVDGPDGVVPPAGVLPPDGAVPPVVVAPPEAALPNAGVPAAELPWRGDDVFVLRPSDSSLGNVNDAGASRFGGDAWRFSTDASRFGGMDAGILDAVNGLDSLDGTPVLDGEGAVLKAVNGVASLHGSDLAGRLVVSHVSQDNALGDAFAHSALRDHDGLDTEVRSLPSLRVEGDVRLQVNTRGQQTWVLVEDRAAAGQPGIAHVSATLADGHALPSWIQLNGHNHIAIDRPVGDDLIVLRITVERGNGDTRTHTIEIDNNANEIREIGRGTHEMRAKDKSAAAQDKAGARTVALAFSAQLAQASHHAAPAIDADLMHALG